MAKLGINNSKRVEFLPGEQRRFLELVKNKLGLKNNDFANLAGITVRTLNDWKREKYRMALDSLKIICSKTEITVPQNIKIKEPFWYTTLGAKKGWIAVYNKYGRFVGDPEKRKKKWYEWWENKGKFKKHPIINVTSPVNLPGKSMDLSEFVGILLGDGGISKRQITITLHKIDDKRYAKYVRNLMSALFSVTPSFRPRKREKVVNIIISRSRLVKFFVDMGLCIGSKVRNQVDIPSWIKDSDRFSSPCIKGLFDTDGCLYIDKHLIKNKKYLNACMNFTNRSLPILNFFKTRLEKFGYHPTQRTRFSIFLRKEAEVIKYFKEIGSANSKHLAKLNQFLKNKYGEVPKWS